ncbi:family 16 glycosylhydrolase [Winogradskyella sp. A3E31]|uniref:glycoside hydrolase family 16 protein n=1 Tax=Winogradskyella sp. A3E31 TaxID=3349637 RepID=UPI00398B5B95
MEKKIEIIIKKNRLELVSVIVLGLITFFVVSCSSDDTQTVTTFDNLVMQDEFDTNGALNPSMWTYDLGNGSEVGLPGWGNNELQYYTDRPENVRVEDGVLKITAIQEQFEGSGYTSARIKTEGLFQQQFGRIEARIKLPWGQGLWPAFWMLGDDNGGADVWPQRGEIDIMENRGGEPTLINGTVHGPGYSGGESITKAFELENDRFDTGFHIFGIEWAENYINFYVDDVLYNQITPADVPGEWVFNDEFFIIMNVAVGGNYGGPPNNDTVFPQTMEVDYIRIYSAN